jgi:hypothetical protein
MVCYTARWCQVVVSLALRGRHSNPRLRAFRVGFLPHGPPGACRIGSPWFFNRPLRPGTFTTES